MTTAARTAAERASGSPVRCAVLGSPIAHSLSPVLHRAAYDVLGLDWVYEAHDVTADRLPGFLDGLDASWRGLSLTMPLKRAVLPLLDETGPAAELSGAVNTVLLHEGRRTGHNTDIPGAVAALRERYDGPLERAVILGGGATATSTLLALADLGCRHVTLLVRAAARAEEIVRAAARHPSRPRVEVRHLGPEPPAVGVPVDVPVDVVVSTIPAAAQTPGVVALADAARVVFDVVYDPWPTPLAVRARREGQVLVGGLDLLVHQAVVQVELMTGSSPAPLAAMRAAGESALAARG
jgi:shikimate dehydrogenase